MLFELREDALAFALSLGPSAEVIEPEDLRQEITGVVQQIVKLYAKRSS
jgi:hypothetical protein